MQTFSVSFAEAQPFPGSGDPNRGRCSSALNPHRLDDRLKIEHLVDTSGDELTHLVDDEHQGLAMRSPGGQLAGAAGELIRVDIRAALSGGDGAGVSRRVCLGV
jgi:hypothetical protein